MIPDAEAEQNKCELTPNERAAAEIKFYNKAVEALPGEKFNGNMIHTWLQVLTDRAYNCAWDNS